jgi:hypothetical protein
MDAVKIANDVLAFLLDPGGGRCARARGRHHAEGVPGRRADR